MFLPGKPHGQRSLAGYSPWTPKKSDTTKLAAGCAEWGLFSPHSLLGDAQPLMHIELWGEFQKFTPMQNPCLIESEALVWGTESTFCKSSQVILTYRWGRESECSCVCSGLSLLLSHSSDWVEEEDWPVATPSPPLLPCPADLLWSWRGLEINSQGSALVGKLAVLQCCLHQGRWTCLILEFTIRKPILTPTQ